MKVLQVNMYESRGGAARAMLRLHAGLCAMGIDSRILVRQKQRGAAETQELNRIVPESERLAEQLFGPVLQVQGIESNRTSVSNTSFTFPFPGFDISTLDLVRESDIINLHWPSYILSPVTLRRLLDLGKPVVWTIHDQWAFTGGCHYSAGCNRFLDSCSPCPQLSGALEQLPGAVLQEWKRQLRDQTITIVGPSRWITDCAKKSSLLHRQTCINIPNGIEHYTYRPEDKAAARKQLGLPENATILLFGADHLGELRKGWRHLRDALCRAAAKLGPSVPLHLLCFGSRSEDLAELPVPVHALGYLDNDDALRGAYNAADLFILSSLDDNQPNTVMESMACGTPVAGFEVGALPDIIQTGANGILVTKGDSDALGDAFAAFVRDRDLQTRMGAAARTTIEQRYRIEDQANAYAQLYQKLLNSSRATPHAPISPSLRKNARLVGDCGAMKNDIRYLRAASQALKLATPTAARFAPGWAFGYIKERRRYAHYLQEWIASREPWLRALITGSTGVYDTKTISLFSGFSEPNGPFPDLHLHRMLIWGRLPSSSLTILPPTLPGNFLDCEVQSPTPGIVLTVHFSDITLWTGSLPANFANPQGSTTRISIPLPRLETSSAIIFTYHLPEHTSQVDNLGLAFLKITLVSRPMSAPL